MKSKKNLFSFGRYLQSIRLEKKISLEKVSEETRIAIGNLQLVEKEDLEALPAEVRLRTAPRPQTRSRAVRPDASDPARRRRTRARRRPRGRP